MLALSNGHRLHTLDVGEGSPILFVHGNPTWSFYWRRLVAALSDRARCVAPDHLGAGLSDKPSQFSYRLDDHIANLVEVIDRLDLHDITLAVHDWGGPIGFGAALARPDRIRRIAVFNTAVFVGPLPLSIRMCRWPGCGEFLIQGLNGFARVALFRAIAQRRWLSDGVADGYLAPYRSPAERLGHLAFVRDIPLDAAHPSWPTVDRMAGAVRSVFADRPSAVFWGEQDFVFTTAFRDRWPSILPQAAMHSYADVGHWIAEEAHERILPAFHDLLDR